MIANMERCTAHCRCHCVLGLWRIYNDCINMYMAGFMMKLCEDRLVEVVDLQLFY